MSNQNKNNNLNYLIDPTFSNINRLFALSFENEDRTSYYKYYLPNIEIKDYNVLIDGNSFFELPIKNAEETYEKIIQITDHRGYYTRGNLLDYEYFIGNLDHDNGAVMFFIIKKSEEAIIEFLQNYASIV